MAPQLNKLIDEARKNNVILGLFLFGTARVGEFLDKGFTFISLGNDLHHVLTQTGAYMKDVTGIAKDKSKNWKPAPQRVALVRELVPMPFEPYGLPGHGAACADFLPALVSTRILVRLDRTLAYCRGGLQPPCHLLTEPLTFSRNAPNFAIWALCVCGFSPPLKARPVIHWTDCYLRNRPARPTANTHAGVCPGSESSPVNILESHPYARLLAQRL